MVFGRAEQANMTSVTPTTLVDSEDIALTPGADRTNGMEMITDYVPAAYVTRDMLHMRGGHQADWLIDGVPIPNTNIATNLGPQIDPKDNDYLEVLRGSYDAEYGDRTYGTFNIVPRTGFREQQRGRARHIVWQLPPNERSTQFRKPYPALRLLCESNRRSQQLRSAGPDRASCSRRG